MRMKDRGMAIFKNSILNTLSQILLLTMDGLYRLAPPLFIFYAAQQYLNMSKGLLF